MLVEKCCPLLGHSLDLSILTSRWEQEDGRTEPLIRGICREFGSSNHNLIAAI